jgi:hypothetical protein
VTASDQTSDQLAIDGVLTNRFDLDRPRTYAPGRKQPSMEGFRAASPFTNTEAVSGLSFGLSCHPIAPVHNAGRPGSIPAVQARRTDGGQRPADLEGALDR